jgi:hypothetical protein
MKIFVALVASLLIWGCTFIFANTPVRLYAWALLSCWSDQCEVDLSHVYLSPWKSIVFWDSNLVAETPSKYWKDPNSFWVEHDVAMRGCVIADFLDGRNDLQDVLYFSCLPEDVFLGPRLIDFYDSTTAQVQVKPVMVERHQPQVCLIRKSRRSGLMPTYSLAPLGACSN